MRLIGLLSKLLSRISAFGGHNLPAKDVAATQQYTRPLPPRPVLRNRDIGFLPQICCDTGRVAGLLVVPPTHLEGDADAALRMGLRQCGKWLDDGLDVPPLVIALPREIAETAELAEPLLWEIDRQDMNTQRVIFSAPASRGRTAPLDGMALLASAGCGVEINCLDQMGLQLLSRSDPVTARSRIPSGFIEDCHSDPQRGKVILSLLAVADRHGAITVAEDVASRKDHGFLAQLGCHVVQGDAVAPVLDANATAHFLGQYAEGLVTAMPRTRPAA